MTMETFLNAMAAQRKVVHAREKLIACQNAVVDALAEAVDADLNLDMAMRKLRDEEARDKAIDQIIAET